MDGLALTVAAAIAPVVKLKGSVTVPELIKYVPVAASTLVYIKIDVIETVVSGLVIDAAASLNTILVSLFRTELEYGFFTVIICPDIWQVAETFAIFAVSVSAPQFELDDDVLT